MQWLKLKRHEIKVNSDLAIVKNCSFLVVIARDRVGKLREAETFKTTTMDIQL